jgi:predicted alpha/beta superfamily hydrolase
MKTQRRAASVYIFALSIVGLATAWYFNSMAVLKAEDYLADGFTSNVDWVYSLDLLIGGTAGMGFIIIEGRRLKMKFLWAYIAAAFVTAFAFVFPLFLAMRELHLQRTELAGGKIKRYNFDNHKVIAWIPKDVGADTPVLVMHDGHNLFDPKTTTFGATWGLLEALSERKVGGARIRAAKQPLIIGITYKNDDGSIRALEYGPTDIWAKRPELLETLSATWARTGADGNAYQDLIAKTVIPTIAAEHGVKLSRERTAIGGSSMGGLSSLYGVAKHPDVYGAALAFSTHWSIGTEQLVDEYIEILPKAGNHKIWSDTGTIELDALYVDAHEHFRTRMAGLGYVEGKDFVAAVYPNTGHSELWWAGRVEHPINWWLDSLEAQQAK